MRNARFWVYINGGPVKLTLKPGQRLTWYAAWSHDEGWSSEWFAWEYDEDGFVLCEHVTDGTDCDGRLTRHYTSTCPIDRLMSGELPYFQDGTSQAEIDNFAGVVWADWRHDNSWQRDEYAEAMGY